MSKVKLFELNILSASERSTRLRVGHSAKEVYDIFSKNELSKYDNIYDFYVIEIVNIDGFDIFPIKSGVEKDTYGEQYPTKEMIIEQRKKRNEEIEQFKEEIRQIRLENNKGSV